MLNANLLKAEIKRNGLTLASTAKMIGVSESTFWRKIRNNSFNLGEADMLIQVLDIKNPGQIFFGQI